MFYKKQAIFLMYQRCQMSHVVKCGYPHIKRKTQNFEKSYKFSRHKPSKVSPVPTQKKIPHQLIQVHLHQTTYDTSQMT